MNKNNQMILSIFLSRVLYFGMGLSYLIYSNESNSMISLLFGMILGYFVLKILLKKIDYNFFKGILGKFLITFTSLYLINEIIIAFTTLGSNFYLTHTPPFIISILLFLLVIYGSSKSINTLERMSTILLYMAIFIIGFIILGTFNNIDFNNYAIYNFKIDLSFIRGIFSSMIYSISPNILLLGLYNEIDSKKILKGYVIGSISIYLTYLLIIGVLGITLSSIYRYPEYALLKKIVMLDFIEKQENFLALIYFIDLFVTGVVSSSVLKRLYNPKTYYMLLISLLLFTLFIFINNYQNVLLIYHYSSYILFAPVVLMLVFPYKKSLKV